MLSFAPLSSTALSSIPGFFAFGTADCALTITDSQVFRVFLATTEFITRSTDTPVNTPFLGTLQKPISFQRSINNGPNGFGGITAGFGESEAINAEADYDQYLGAYGADGQRGVIKVGSRAGGVVAPYAEFVTISDLTATGWLITEEVVRVFWRDNSYKLEVPTQPNVYGGTGNLDGSSDLAGKRKPRALGQCPNVTPAFLIPSELVYHINDGPVQAISSVFDSGFALTFSADYATSVLLRNATIIAGQYATCIAEALFRLGADPQGKVTANVQGDNSTGYVSTTADIVEFLLGNACGLPSDVFDLLTFDTLNTIQPAVRQYYLGPDSNETVAQTISNLMEGIGGWAGFTRLGLFEVRRLDAPGIAPVERYDQIDFLNITTDKLPSGIDPIVQRVRVTYNHNFTIQQGTEVTGSVGEFNPTFAAFLAAPYSIALPSTDQTASILARHPLAHDPDPIIGYFANFADAQAEADRRMTLYGVDRLLYRFTVKDHMLGQDVGDTVFISDPRLGIDDGIYLRVVQANDDIEKNETEVVGFG